MDYKKTYEIFKFMCDENLNMRVENILNIFTETAMLEDREFIFQHDNLMWVLYGWDLEIFDYPLCGDRVEVSTQYLGAEKFFAYRNFYLNGKSGKLARAKSLWLVIDKDKGELLRIPKKSCDNDLAKCKGDLFDRKKKIAGGTYASKSSFRVLKRDLDFNQHMNNANTLSYIMDALDFKAKRIEIVYKKQIFLYEKFSLAISENDKWADFKILGSSPDDIRSFGRIYKWEEKR
ncbi:Acyl-ACP thioesterase [Clostridiales bacterium KA00134]|nr:Acyl-ACP thioesterase [Clostridiales bacterium KA00134]